jgi:hypothetical protein
MRIEASETMPVSWSICGAIVHVESDEAATFAEWTAAIDAAFADSAFEPGMSVVHDLRRMARVPSSDEARARADFLVERSCAHGVVRWAVVVSRPVQYGMARMAEAFSDGAPTTFRAFRALDEAQEWARGRSLK